MKFNKVQEEFKGPSKFLKIPDGQSVNGVFRGEIHTFYNKWVNGKGQEVGPDEPGAKPRFKLNFVTYENGAFIAKIFEFPQTVYNQLADIHEVYPLDKTKVQITRRGTGTDTVYMILPLVAPKDVLSPGLLQQIEAVQLNVLDASTQPGASNELKNLLGDPSPTGELPF
jgi:hypothetical protein